MDWSMVQRVLSPTAFLAEGATIKRRKSMQAPQVDVEISSGRAVSADLVLTVLTRSPASRGGWRRSFSKWNDDYLTSFRRSSSRFADDETGGRDETG
jgi:hypothetical protein